MGEDASETASVLCSRWYAQASCSGVAPWRYYSSTAHNGHWSLLLAEVDIVPFLKLFFQVSVLNR